MVATNLSFLHLFPWVDLVLSSKKNRMPILLPLVMVDHPIGLALNLHLMQSSIALSVSKAGIVLLCNPWTMAPMGYILNFNTVPDLHFFSFFLGQYPELLVVRVVVMHACSLKW